ncbi:MULTISPECIES: AAA family ATPase [unclassified Arthrobacter]|uniref:AAA family ATPase n=1 Tax=unclassified Arthrobacter TaxID=235627 RepID=UPI001E4B3B4C|nr:MULTISPECIES: AAA family ATPase [unclassified Arthrobacter]MCC9144505.1 AAA family ATPase [Arthrobacter sp. zg-Y919]MDK1275731.1 AAA family ATPase [Arthrobacter sp. zg.Y919]WIB02902.1 AAA family ATPase [Arthrobacter sp. zg-Y919]
MRLKEIVIVGFGGVASEIRVDLDADVVIVVGANGYGKTTICNAIAWVLSGKSPGSQGPQNLYTKSGTTSVELKVDFDGESASVVRSVDNPDESDPRKQKCPLRVRLDNRVWRGQEAEGWLRRQLAGSESDEDFETVVNSFIDSIYLRQESLREFLTVREDTERFDAVARMVGAGRLREFADGLQSQKVAWVKASNQADTALADERGKLEDLKASLEILESEIASADRPEVQAHWRDWLKEVRALDLRGLSDLGDAELTEESLSRLRTSLSRDRSEVEQKVSALTAIQGELSVPLPDYPDDSTMENIAAEIIAISMQKDEAETQAAALQEAVIEAEDVLRRAESLREDMANMANILLRHVSDHCAACGQSVAAERYRARLELMAADSEDVRLRTSVNRERVQLDSAKQRVREADLLLRQLTDDQRGIRERRAAALAARQHREERLREVLRTAGVDTVQALDVTSGLDRIRMELEYLTLRRDQIRRASEAGGQFEAVAALRTTKSRRDRIMAEASEIRHTLDAKESDIAARRHTNDVAASLLELVKADADKFVSERLSQLQPLLGQFYSAIDPHPTFRSVGITTRSFRGKHRLTPVLRDEESKIDVGAPGETLSTSQANALAVSIFLAFNLGFSPAHMKALVLDDPLQNLDDVHLLGLVDLLRKILPFRQLVVTTHDHAFASLLARKLRPIAPGARTTYVSFTKWDRNGPGVEQWDVPGEARPIKFVGSGLHSVNVHNVSFKR